MKYVIVVHDGFVSCCTLTPEGVKALLNKMYGQTGTHSQQNRKVSPCITNTHL